MIVTTTPNIQGRVIRHYLGLVETQTAFASKMLSGTPQAVKEVAKGQPVIIEGYIDDAREMALRHLEKTAEEAGGNAIVGLAVDYQVLGAQNDVMFVFIRGTAVVVE